MLNILNKLGIDKLIEIYNRYQEINKYNERVMPMSELRSYLPNDPIEVLILFSDLNLSHSYFMGPDDFNHFKSVHAFDMKSTIINDVENYIDEDPNIELSLKDIDGCEEIIEKHIV